MHHRVLPAVASDGEKWERALDVTGSAHKLNCTEESMIRSTLAKSPTKNILKNS